MNHPDPGYEKMIRHISKWRDLTDEDRQLIVATFEKKQVSRNELAFEEGKICSYAGFILNGSFRYYGIDEQGEEYITYFAFEDYWIGEMTSLLDGTPAAMNCQAMEDSILLVADGAGYKELMKNCPSFSDYVMAARNRSFNKLMQMAMNRLSKTAEERYAELLETHPLVFARVPLKYIAAFLGIKQESLSRIRKKLMEG